MDAPDHLTPHPRGNSHPLTERAEDAHALALQRALLALDAGHLDEAHLLLTRLLRGHTTDPEVVFPLALVRSRLGYHASAEILFAQAFDYGYIISDAASLQPIEGHPQQVSWTDPSGSVRLTLAKRPRARAMRLLHVSSIPRPSSPGLPPPPSPANTPG
jgi:hypothetical protein